MGTKISLICIQTYISCWRSRRKLIELAFIKWWMRILKNVKVLSITPCQTTTYARQPFFNLVKISTTDRASVQGQKAPVVTFTFVHLSNFNWADASYYFNFKALKAIWEFILNYPHPHHHCVLLFVTSTMGY